MNQTHDRFAILDQRDIHGKFVVTANKFRRAIQRVHQPVEMPLLADRKGDLFPFFREDRDIRGQQLKALFDNFMSGNIGLCQRGLIRLLFDIVAIAVKIQDARPGLDGQ